MIKFIFWLSFAIIFYTYFGYPFLLWIISKLFSKPVQKEHITPKVSFVVVVNNEEQFIERKIKNILELDYPKENLEVIIGSDGSTDNTNKIIESYKDKGVRLKSLSRHIGKVNVLNKIVPQATGEIVVFSDVRQKFEKKALKELVANFSDSSVGSVSGELIFTGENENGVSKGVGFYWKYEKWMRRMESSIHSMIGATGAIYAIRKRLFVAPPPDTILDDVFIPLKVVEQGFRAIFDAKARAYDKVASTSGEEFRRKVRTLAGNFQLFMQCRNLFNPFRSRIGWQFFSHKFLRAVAFLFLITLFIMNLFLKSTYPYNIVLALQIIFYLLALTGWEIERLRIKSKIVSFPYIFCVLNLAALEGFFKFFSGKQKVTWEKAK